MTVTRNYHPAGAIIACVILLTMLSFPGLALAADPAFEMGWREDSLVSDTSYYDSRIMETVYVSSNDLCFKYGRAGEYEKQVKACTRDIGMKEFNTHTMYYGVADRYYNRGNAYYGLGDYGRAMADYDKAIELHQIPEAYNNRGLIYYRKGDYARAIADYTEAIENITVHVTRPYINRGDAYFLNGDYGRAIADYTAAIRLEPSRFFYSHLEDYAYRFDKAGARSEYKKAISGVYYKRGLAYRRIGKMDQAEADQKEAIAILRNVKQLPGLASGDE